MPTLAQLAFDKANLLACSGYDPAFISKQKKINLLSPLSTTQKKLLPVVEGNKDGVLHYTGMSVVYNKSRRLPFYAAYNIDGKGKKADTKSRPPFHIDPRVKDAIQNGFDFYDLDKTRTEFEIGHMASNNEMGRGVDGQLKAFQTFHFTNAVPQAERLNTGIWKALETYVIDESVSLTKNSKICVFTGPLIKRNDPKYVLDESFRIPLLFFKVIVFPTSKGIFSTAFMMSHEKKMIEDEMFASGPQALGGGSAFFEDFPYKKVFQVDISFLEKESGLKFSWPGVKKVKVPDVKNQIKKIKSIQDAKDAKKAIAEKDLPEGLTMRLAPHQKEDARKSVKKGLVPEALLSDANLSAKELKDRKFKLNIVLP